MKRMDYETKRKYDGYLKGSKAFSIIGIIIAILGLIVIVGSVIRISQLTGKYMWFEDWSFNTDGNIHVPLVLGDLDQNGELEVVIGSYDGNIYAVTADNGAKLWNYSVSTSIYSPIALGDINGEGGHEIVFKADYNYKIFALNGSNGTLLWNSTIGGYKKTSLGDIDHDGDLEIFTSGTDDKLFALNGENGTQIWNTTIGPMPYTSAKLGDLDKDGNLEVIAGNYEGHIYALVGSNGTQLWNVSTYIPFRSDPALGDIDNDDHLEIVFGDIEGNVFCLEGNDGSVVWNHSIGAPFDASPAIDDINGDGELEVVIGDTNGVISCLEGNTGALIWNYSVNSFISSQVSLGDIYGDGDLEVVIGAGRNGLIILDGLTGDYIWNVPTVRNVYSTPTLNDINNDGILDVFIGSKDNNAYLLKGEVGPRTWVYTDTDIGISIMSAGAILTLLSVGLYSFRITQLKKNTPIKVNWTKGGDVFRDIKQTPKRGMEKNIEYNIQTHTLKKVYGNKFSKESVVAVNGIDLLVQNGIHGFLGPNGAGKTTTMKMLIGSLPITSGSAKVKGFDAGSLHAKDLVGYMPQELGFYRKMTGEEYLIYMARLSGMEKNNAIQAAKFLLAKFELEDATDRQLSKYSSGMVQKIGLAVSFIGVPEILILDEPTSDLDPIGRNTIISHIKELSEDAGIFVSSHILSEIEQMCDTVSIINNGELILTDTIENLKSLYGDGTFRFIIDTGDNRKLLTHLEEQPFIEQVSINPKTNNINVITKDVSKMEQFIKEMLIDLDISLKKFTQEEVSLQDIFLQLVQSEEKK